MEGLQDLKAGSDGAVSRKIKAVIFDYGRTLYDKEADCFFPEVGEVLEYLSKRYKLAIVSLAREDFKEDERRESLRVANYDRYFFSVMFDPVNKDHLFEETLKKTGLKVEEAAFVDDRVKRSIAWGNKHGGMTIWLRKGMYADELPDEQTGNPTYTIDNLLLLKKIL